MRWFLLLSLPLYILDQVTKAVIVANFAAPGTLGGIDYVPVIDGFFNIVRVHNTGIAFGRFNGTPYANLAFSIVAAAALFVIGFLWRRGAFPTRIGKTAAALLVSGIVGNFTDRIFRGYVVDFLDFNLGFMRWPSFNVADSCICIAAGLLFISAFQNPPASESGQADDSAAPPDDPARSRDTPPRGHVEQ